MDFLDITAERLLGLRASLKLTQQKLSYLYGYTDDFAPKFKSTPTAFRVVYARYSSVGQREESVEGQLRECNANDKKQMEASMENKIDDINLNSEVNATTVKEPKLLYFTRSPLGTVVAARPETGSAVILNPQTNKWDYSDKDFYQIISDTNYDQITEEEAKNIFGDNLPKFGFLDMLDVLKMRMRERE